MITLYEHQQTALNLLRLFDGFALFMEQGTGKTFPVLYRLCELIEDHKIESALIVAPKAVLPSWDAKIEMLTPYQQGLLNSIDLRTVSYDMVWRRKEYTEHTFNAVILDESHYIKTPSAKRTKACIKISSRAKYRYILTGTPTSNGQLCNLWSQFAAIDPEIVKNHIYPRCFGGKSYYRWLEEVAYLNQYHKPYKYRNVDLIQKTMGELSYRITKAECLDLPEKLPDEIFYCSMSDNAKKHYKEMMKSSVVTELDTLASNPLVRSLRLRQLASGFFTTDAGTIIEYPNTKLAVLKEYLSDFEKKVVIFCQFTHSIDAVAKLLDDMGKYFVVLNGHTTDKSIWQDFQIDPEIDAIICQYQSGSAGIDLYAADTCIFFEPTLSSNINEQAKDRIHRVGQKHSCSYIYLLSEGTIEFAIYNALLNYEDFSETLFTEYIHEYTKGEKLHG